MKKRLLILVRVLSFLIICLVLMNYLSHVLTVRDVEEWPTRNGFDQYLNAEDDNTIDVMFVGDSSVMHAVIPAQIWEDTKITSYVMSFSVMQPYEAYFGLKKVFEKQSPKCIFLESQFLVKLSKGNYDYSTGSVRNTVDYLENQITGSVNDVLPVMSYKGSWRTRKLSDLAVNHPDAINNVYKGYHYAAEVVPFKGEHDPEPSGIVVYKNNGDTYFEKIISLCNEHGCEVVLCTMPQGSDWNQKSHDKIDALAKSYNIKYYDYDINLDRLIPSFSWNADTKDGGGHLNYSGAKKVTKVISNNLISDLKFTSSKLTRSQFDKWNADSREFYDMIIF